jgi:hypothetical protein
MKTSAAMAAVCLLCTSAMADELDLSFNDDAFRAYYVYDFESNDLAWDAGLVNNSDKGFVAYGSLLLTGFASDGLNPLEGGLGARTGWIDGDDSGQNGVPVAVGGYLKYTFPNLNRVSVRVDAYYAPEVISIKDVEQFEDYTIRIAYNLLREADLYLGARYVKAEFDNDTEQTFDNGMHIGISLRF